MSNEEFEDLFGNTPFKNIEKINKHIKENYIPKQVIRDKIEELKKEVHNYYGCEEADLVHDNMLSQIEVLKELLGE